MCRAPERSDTSSDTGASTGPGTSIDELKDRQERAGTAARVADVSFAVSVLSGAAAALLWHQD
ncbi:MAG: hypothetical protein QM756_10225 [Polyangiaceae bacterium]